MQASEARRTSTSQAVWLLGALLLIGVIATVAALRAPSVSRWWAEQQRQADLVYNNIGTLTKAKFVGK